MSVETYQGSCHCGAVRFEADLDLADGSNRCNCSYCAKVRAWFTFAKGADRFRVLDGAAISEFRWVPPGDDESHLTFSFCRTCGVRCFARGNLEHLGGTFHAVHVPTLALTTDQLLSMPIRYINGRDRRYDETPAHTETI
jgi:hypothetical protein